MLPRLRRFYSKDHFHHVTSRGNWRGDLFRDRRDYEYFLKRLELLHEEYGIEIAAYCLMPNHYHLQIRTKEMHLSKIMARLNKKYADRYNRKYNVSGHLFEKRFFSKPIFDPIGIAEVSSYIHLNPVKARLVDYPEEYEWSSYKFFFKPKSSRPSFLQIDPLLNLFPGETTEQRIKQYCTWVELKSQTLEYDFQSK